MSLYDVLLKSMPSAAFKLYRYGDTYGDIYVDYYGIGGSVDVTGNRHTLTGAMSFVSPIINGNNAALSVKTASMMSTTTSVFLRGHEQRSFALSSWVLPTTFSANISILSHTGIYDGLYFDGSNINFKINFSTLGSVVASWPVPDFPEVYHVVGMYSPQHIQLYINGVLKQESDISTAQLADGFAAEPSAVLYSGQSASGTGRLIVDGIAIFARTLTSNEVLSHFLNGRRVPTMANNVSAGGGVYWEGSNRDVVLNTKFSTTSDWNTGLGAGISNQSDVLIPLNDMSSGLSLAGTWVGFSPISGTDSTSLSGIRASWDASGSYTIAYSTDNITFTNLTDNGQLIPGTIGLDTTGLTLFIRVIFTGGIANDTSQVRDIILTSYSSPNVYGSDQSRTLALSGAVATSLESHEPIERHSNAGLTMYGGYATLSADASALSVNLAAIEFWIKPTSLSANAELYDARPTYGYLMYNSGGNLTYTGHSEVYINGVLAASNTVAPTIGEWMHILYIPTTPYNAAAIIGQKYTFVEPFLGQIGMIATYGVAPTATQALALYNSYMQNPAARAIDTAGITLTELSTAYTNYSLNWSAISASV